MPDYAPSPEELIKKAILYWPSELVKREMAASVIPLLISTQDKFISILDVSDSAPDAWKLALAATSEMPANLFLKHLMVLSDIGGEPLKRIRTGFTGIFPDAGMSYVWKGQTHKYAFKVIPTARSLTNRTLFVDGKRLHTPHGLEPLMEDVIMLILHGAAATGPIPAILKEKCILGSLMGRVGEVEDFVKQRYIWLGQTTRHIRPSQMEQLCRAHVVNMLLEELPGWTITCNGFIQETATSKPNDLLFDIVARSPTSQLFVIEVGFYFIAGDFLALRALQAETKANLVHKAGGKIVYVIANAYNVRQFSSLATICRHSDYIVAFTQKDMASLVKFMRANL